MILFFSELFIYVLIILTDMNWNYNIPSFDGSSHIRIKPMKAYYKFDVEIEFKTNTNNGIMFYNGQHIDGKGDFISLAIINGYLEFRYNLGKTILQIQADSIIFIASICTYALLKVIFFNKIIFSTQ